MRVIWVIFKWLKMAHITLIDMKKDLPILGTGHQLWRGGYKKGGGGGEQVKFYPYEKGGGA